MRILLASVVIALTYLHGATAAPRAPASSQLKVCSFNVQIFGRNKVKNTKVMDILGRIFSKYDLCLIQEIRDTGDDSINALLKQINGKTDNYRMVVSDRLGRSNSKEQYGFFYNKNKINITDSFHFDDERAGDLFEREPFIVRFKVPSSPVKDFFIGGIHTNPGDAKAEIANLVQVYEEAAERFGIEDGIIMGDFNAGCGYFAKKYWGENALRTDDRFVWLIDDDVDTTVGKADCAYDRIVVGGSNLQKYAKNGQAWYYDEDFDVDEATVKLVSDHYPIEFTIG